jgi:hypothetical protein
MLEITFGILPENLHARSIITARLCRSPIVGVIGPDKPLLYDICRNFRFLRLPIEDGNRPEKAQSEIVKDSNLVRFPIDDGIGSVKPQYLISKLFKCVRFPIQEGIILEE